MAGPIEHTDSGRMNRLTKAVTALQGDGSSQFDGPPDALFDAADGGKGTSPVTGKPTPSAGRDGDILETMTDAVMSDDPDFDFDEVRRRADLMSRDGQVGQSSYAGPSDGFTGMESDEYMQSLGRKGVQEKVRNIFGVRGVPL